MDVKNLDKIITKIGKKYPKEKIYYENLIKSWKKLLNTEFLEQISEEIEKIQENCNEYYAKYGITKELLELQIWINETRNKYNIHDPREVIHEEKDKDFVQ